MSGRSGSIQLARLFGIRIGVTTSWFVVLFFFIFILSGQFRQVLDSSDGVAYLTAVVSALLFFCSLVAHELGHALVGRRLGINTSGIDLWFFGGIAKMDRDADSAGTEFKVAAAGPAVTLLIVIACVVIGVLTAGWPRFWDAVVLNGNVHVSPALLLLSWLAAINAAVFAFNLLPAFPLDGGRIARAVAWKLTGDRLRATRAAATLGQGFAWLMMAGGLVEVLATGSVVSGLWLIFLGWFLGQAARGAVAQTAFAERIEGVTVADIMDREPVAIPADSPVSRALDEFFLRYQYPWFPVVDADRRLIGLAERERVLGAERRGEGARPVREVMEGDLGDWRIADDDTLESLLGSDSLRRVGALLAVDHDGRLRGVVTLDQVRRALEGAALNPR
jgi:Zn-dependent protease